MKDDSGKSDNVPQRDWIFKLQYVRSAIEKSSHYLKTMLEYDLAHAAILFDGAVETFMLTALSYLCECNPDIKGKECCKPKPNDENFWKIKGRFSEAIGLANFGLNVPNSLGDLHAIRNLVQHRGRMPNRKDLERLLPEIERDFMIPAAEKIFDEIDLHSISPSYLIRNKEVQRVYKISEDAFARQKYLESLEYCVAAFETALHIESKYKIGGYDSRSLHINAGSYEEPLSSFAYEVMSTIGELEILTITFKLGLDFKTHQLLHQIFKFCFELKPIEYFIQFEWKKLENNEVEDVVNIHDKELVDYLNENFDEKFSKDLQKLSRFYLDYCLENILRWESIQRESYLKYYGIVPSNTSDYEIEE